MPLTKQILHLSKTKIKAYFFTGLFTALPVTATLLVGWFILKFFIKILSLPLHPFLKIDLPGMQLVVPLAGLIITVTVIILIGILMASLIGKSIVAWFEDFINRVPLVGNLYGAFKQLLGILHLNGKETFSRVVVVEYPLKGVYSVGFVTSEENKKVADVTGKKIINLYIPTALNIASGFLIMVPAEEVIPLNISIEEGLKLVISGGLITPSFIDQQQNSLLDKKEGKC